MSQDLSYFDGHPHLSDEAVALYVDAIRIGKVYQLPSAVLDHVAECGKCKGEILEVFSMQEGVENREKHPYFGREHEGRGLLTFLPYRMAAVCVVAIGVSMLLYYLRVAWRDETLPQKSLVASETGVRGDHAEAAAESSSAQPRLFADDFTLAPNLENLVDAQSRSSSVRVLSPLQGTTQGGKILFRWKSDQSDVMTLKILSNKEKTLHVFTVRNSRYVFAEKVPPGVYYWKLESRDELLYVGKFIVR